MQIEEEDEEPKENSCWKCCSCCWRRTANPDFRAYGKFQLGAGHKRPYFETGYLVPNRHKSGSLRTLEDIRLSCAATKGLPSPMQAIIKNNKKKGNDKDYDSPSVDMNILDVNNLLRRRLSLRVLISEEDQSGERGEAILPKRSNFLEAAPIILSQLVKGSEKSRRSIVKSEAVERFRSSYSFSKTSLEDLTKKEDDIELKSDKEFFDYLIKTSNFMKEALEKDWPKTRNYIRWLESYVKSSKFAEKSQESPEKWMVVLYTSSEDSHDQLTNFRCMLVRWLMQHHCVVYEERDITLPQYEREFQDRLLGDKMNVPQVFMQGLNLGGYRVVYGIHKMKLFNVIFQKFVLSNDAYASWMFNKESKATQLNLDVNLKAFPAVQALAGSWANDKLSFHHLEFVTMGKFVVKHARETWYHMMTRPYIEPDLRRYALLRLTIIHTLSAMNKIYKLYMNKIEPEGSIKLRRKLSWLPKFSRQLPP